MHLGPNGETGGYVGASEALVQAAMDKSRAQAELLKAELPRESLKQNTPVTERRELDPGQVTEHLLSIRRLMDGKGAEGQALAYRRSIEPSIGKNALLTKAYEMWQAEQKPNVTVLETNSGQPESEAPVALAD